MGGGKKVEKVGEVASIGVLRRREWWEKVASLEGDEVEPKVASRGENVGNMTCRGKKGSGGKSSNSGREWRRRGKGGLLERGEKRGRAKAV